MSNKVKDIAIAVIVFSTVIVFVMGMILWPYMPKEGALSKLFYICSSSALYALSLVCFIVASSKWWKVASYIGLAVFGINLYVELFLDPQHWTNWSLGLLIVVPTNIFLVAVITEKIKNGKNSSHN